MSPNVKHTHTITHLVCFFREMKFLKIPLWNQKESHSGCDFVEMGT